MRLIPENTPISFPGLGIDQIDPPSGFTLFGSDFEVKFYGVIIALGVLMAVLYCMKRSKTFGLTSDDILNAAIIGVPSAVIGARLYYVLLYGTPFNQWLSIRDGGLAIYGGVIGAVLGYAVFSLTSRQRRRKFLATADIAGLGLLIGQFMGRWGNFFNREAFGSYCDNFLAMRLPEKCIRGLAEGPALELLRSKAIEDGYEGFVQVHPTFLYESLWNLVGFVLLHFLSKKRRFDGQIFLYYIAWYGLGRFIIEGLRTDSLMGGGIRASQVLALVSLLLSVGILVYVLITKKPNGNTMLVNQTTTETKTEE
ncbi:MAG: prolipoprotein diacylglyceryl transferase [Oscillospiraceae bacterium]|nr:prolipoprotein diacylglyceryl transferase [Oscillospiraceae bacterium]